MTKLRLLIGIVLLTSYQLALADYTTIWLICTNSQILDPDKGSMSPTSGESLFSVRYLDDGSANIRMQDRDVYFAGYIREEEIVGQAKYYIEKPDIRSNIEALAITQHLKINRYSGAFILSFENAKGRFLYYGTCRPADKPPDKPPDKPLF